MDDPPTSSASSSSCDEISNVAKKRSRAGSRPDVALKRAHRQTVSITCISVKWNQVCTNSLVRKHMPHLLLIVNKLALIVYPFLNYYVCRLYELDPQATVEWSVEL